MDLSEKENFGLSSEWQFDSSTIENPMNSSPIPCPSVSMVDSLCSDLYSQQTNPHNPIGKPLPMGWNPSILSSSLSHIPGDSGFIERAARFSCFNGGSFSAMVNNPVTAANEPLSPYPSASKGVSDSQNPTNVQRDNRGSNNELGEAEFSGDGQENSSSRGNGAKKRKRTNQVDYTTTTTTKHNQDMELDQAQGASPMSVETAKKNLDNKKKGEKSSTEANGKTSGKNAKDSAEGSKEDYIHVRARRGQATNSHSLAERVRREKISERMKFLQDLVPSCSKVTGKAVMLDEIINYVQSLQRQVEFLSMKLAAVNPRLDFNIDGLLSKDLLNLRPGGSSAPGFSLEMINSQLHALEQGLVQAGIPGMGNPSDALRRVINAQLPQMPNTWEDEFHNVVQMNFGSNLPFNAQELNTKPRDGFSL